MLPLSALNMTIGTVFLAHGAMQLAWDIIFDRVKPLRKITHKNSHKEATAMLISQLKEMDCLKPGGLSKNDRSESSGK